MWNYAGLYLPNRMAFNQAKVADSMDVLFHGLIGAIIGECAPKSIKNRRIKGALAAMSPDLANIPLYLYLGMKVRCRINEIHNRKSKSGLPFQRKQP